MTLSFSPRYRVDLHRRMAKRQLDKLEAEVVNLFTREIVAWEQGRVRPSKAMRSYLRVISVDPDAVLKALKREKREIA